MHYLLALLIGITLTTTPLPDGRLAIVITADAPVQLYAEMSGDNGIVIQETPYLMCNLQAGESCSAIITPIRSIHAGNVTIRVWDNTGEPPRIERLVPVPARAGCVFLPIV